LREFWLRVFSLLFSVFLAACSTTRIQQLPQVAPDLPAQAHLTNIPFTAQEAYECGPATLHMLLGAAGRVAPLDELVNAVYVPGRHGSFQVEMLAAARRQGLNAYTLEPEIASVLREVAGHHPVAVFMNLSLPIYPVWHYAVVTGYDLERNVLVLHSGTTRNMEMSLYTFDRTWQRGGNWAMVALNPQDLPVTAQPQRMLAALSALEQTDPKAAAQGYSAARLRWPQQREFLLAEANAAYVQHDLAQAERGYLAATQQFPDYADAWNNLAQTYADQHKSEAALNAIEHAIEIATRFDKNPAPAQSESRLAQYKSLRDELLSAQSTKSPSRPD